MAVTLEEYIQAIDDERVSPKESFIKFLAERDADWIVFCRLPSESNWECYQESCRELEAQYAREERP